MMFSWILLLLGVHFGSCRTPLPLPSYITPCHRSDTKFDECCLREARKAIPTIVKGDRKYGYPPLNPLHLDKISVDNYGGLKINLTDVVIDGIEKIQMTKVKYDLDKMNVNFEGIMDKVIFKSKYDLQGRILFVDLGGSGNMVLDIDGVGLSINSPFKTVTIDGEEYFQSAARNDSVNLTVKGVKVNLDNLFNGNEQLTKSTNEVLNENWRSFYEEIKPAISKTIETIAFSILDNTSKKVPFKVAFPE